MTPSSRIAVVGAGSMGGYLGAILALAGEDVTFIARGETLKAVKKGFTLIDQAGKRIAVPAKGAAIDDTEPFDLVILALKAQQIGDVAAKLKGLLHAETPILVVQNGIPWWYFHGTAGPLEGRQVKAVDPDGEIGAHIETRRVIGGVIYAAASVVAPGVVHVTETSRMIIGEPDGKTSARAADIAARITRAGFETTVSAEIRTAIWTKLWGNAVFNPLSALTRAGLADMANDPAVRAIARAGMLEVEYVAAQFGIRMPMTVDERIAVAASLGNHKTSMLQDIEAGRAPELNANVEAVAELAGFVDVPTPTLDFIHTCAQTLAKTVTA